MVGAKYVQSVLGGYRNYVRGTRFMALAAAASMLACVVLTTVALIKNVAKVRTWNKHTLAPSAALHPVTKGSWTW